MSRGTVLAAVGGWLAITAIGSLQAAGQGPSTTSSPSGAAAAHRAVLNRYCVTCHNDRLKTAGLALDTLNLDDVSVDAAVWEQVIRKLRTNAMPPPGRPRPEAATQATLVGWLESSMHRQATANPRPGRTEAIHRLNRAEYQNAIRDLLGVDVDVASMLPADDMSYGFDNIAGVLKTPPSPPDRYMAAARHISRVAIGSPTIPPTAETFRLRADLSQDISFDSLPIGTRGGTAIRYQFPLDAEYVIGVEPLAGGTDVHQLEVTIDGERVRMLTIGPRRVGMAAAGDTYDSADDTLEVRVPVKAGLHVVGVTFIKKTSALVETLREPFEIPHAEGGQRSQPYLGSVTIAGPFAATGAEGSQSRARILSCRPTSRAAEAGCAKQILSQLARSAYRRPVTDAELNVLLDFYNNGRGRSTFEGGMELALRRLLVSPQFLYRIETDPAGGAP